MRMMLKLNEEDIKKLPYQMIAETASRSIWNTGKRKRLWAETFNKNERDACNAIIRQAKKWMFQTGTPDELVMSLKTYELWHTLALFCVEMG